MQTGPISLFISERGAVINLNIVGCAYWVGEDFVNSGAKKTLRVLLMGESKPPEDEGSLGFEFDDEEGDEFVQALIDFHELQHSRKG